MLGRMGSRLQGLKHRIARRLNRAAARAGLPWSRLNQVEAALFRDIPAAERGDVQVFDRLYKLHGPLRSTAGLTADAKLAAELHFHFREKAEVALTAGSSWYGGDYFEFGAHDLNTFRNMLSAYDMCGMTQAYTDVRFYAFDIFGDLPTAASVGGAGDSSELMERYFSPYSSQGNAIELHQRYLDQHNLFRDKCFLIQGLFKDTLTPEFKRNYLGEQRKIGFAFLDCNMGSSYRTVFEFIFDMMGENSLIYMDEYLQNPAVPGYFQQFTDELRKQRNMGYLFIRNAGGFGALFRLYPLGTDPVPLNLKMSNAS